MVKCSSPIVIYFLGVPIVRVLLSPSALFELKCQLIYFLFFFTLSCITKAILLDIYAFLSFLHREL